jgi:group I intron endonuclease
MSGQTYTIYLIEDHRMKPYVGVTSKTPEERFRKHKTAARINRDSHLYRAIRKYGEEKFEIIPLDTATTKEKAYDLEEKWISKLGSYKNWGYNMTKGGEGTALTGDDNPMYGLTGKKHPRYGESHSSKTRQKLSESKKGEKNPNYGKPIPEKTRQKISKSLRGEQNSNSKITRQEAAEIKYLAQKGDRNQKDIGNEYGISNKTVSNIKKRKYLVSRSS